MFTPRYSWNTAKVGVKHQSINQTINQYAYQFSIGFWKCSDSVVIVSPSHIIFEGWTWHILPQTLKCKQSIPISEMISFLIWNSKMALFLTWNCEMVSVLAWNCGMINLICTFLIPSSPECIVKLMMLNST